MKKKLLSLILCAVMIMTALPVVMVPATAADPETCAHANAVWTYEDDTPWVATETTENKKMTCSDCGTEIVFKPQNCKPWQTGNVYLTVDSTSDDWYQDISSAKVIHFDLNGHTLTAASNKSAIRTASNYTFNLYDSVGTGKILASASGSKAISVIAGHTLNVYGGEIFGTVSNLGTLNVYGGHTYDNLCDTTCNVSGCGATRDADHVYENEYDASCNSCGFERDGAVVCVHANAVWTYEDDTPWVETEATANKKMTCPTCEVEIVFNPLTGTEPHKWNTKAYYLTGDCTVSSAWYAQHVNPQIDLNGYSIKSGGAYPAIDVKNGNDLGVNTVSIYDGSANKTGTIVAKSGQPAIKVAGGATFNLYGGTITGCTSNAVQNYGNFNMYGGKITGNNGAVDGTVYLGSSSPVFKMYGGEISGNSTNNGGAISCWTNSAWDSANDRIAIAIYGGKITGNTATGTGGAINLAQLNGSLLIAGGEISGNKAGSHSGVCGGSTSGKVTVTGGTVDYIGNVSAGVSITGGQFKQDYTSNGWIAEDHTAFEVNEGNYVVGKTADGYLAAAVRIGTDANTSGIKFKAIFADSGLVKGDDANFGVLVIAKSKYDAIVGAKDYAALLAAGAYAAAATTGIEDEDGDGAGVYTTIFTVYNVDAADYAKDLVVVKYVDGAIVGTEAVRSVQSVAQAALADPDHDAQWDTILNVLAGN